ncbi:hypothetical protein DRW03_06355 [Corallococcus sp. H22C18031201]|nr:hypothetical protein DRW03_06355 [Corallococcus sp. H22C18031201]
MGSCALGLGAVHLKRKREEEEAAVLAASAPPPEPEAEVTKPDMPAALLADAARQVPSIGQITHAVTSGLKTGGTFALGIAMLNTMGDVATVVGGEGAGDVARAGIGGVSVGVGAIVGKGSQVLAEQVGIGKETSKTIGQLAGAGAALGPYGIVAAAGIKAIGEGGKFVVGKVFGQDAAQSVSNVTKQFDPFLKGSLLNKPVAAVGKGVKAIGKVIGKIF